MRLRILYATRLPDGTELPPGTEIDIPPRLVAPLCRMGNAEVIMEPPRGEPPPPEVAMLAVAETATLRRGRPRGRPRKS